MKSFLIKVKVYSSTYHPHTPNPSNLKWTIEGLIVNKFCLHSLASSIHMFQCPNIGVKKYEDK